MAGDAGLHLAVIKTTRGDSGVTTIARPIWLFEAIVALVALVVLVVLAVFWMNGRLTQPESRTGTIRVGVDSPNDDTRVFFSFDEWTDFERQTLRVVLGQSRSAVMGEARFRIEFRGFLEPVDPASCPDRSSASTCFGGDGSLVERESEPGPGVVLEGEFESTGFFSIHSTPTSASGASRKGPYRSAFYEFLPLDSDGPSRLPYPSRGVEVEFSTDVGLQRVRYDTFFPDQPYRLYPDGWAFLVEEPGGPAGVQFTLIDDETSRQLRSEWMLLFIGVLLAVVVQAAYEGIKDFVGE